VRYTVTKQRIQIIGKLWMPSTTAATVTDLSAYDLENIGNLKDREAVASWLATHAGDFSQVLDFRADFHVGNKHIVHEWASEDSECTFNDCMYPEEDGAESCA
jgi:hypothetical protein